MSDAYITVSSETFDRDVLHSDKPVIVDFWAEWCKPCLMYAPIFEDVAREYQGKMVFAKVDTEANEDLVMRYKVFSIPMLLVYYKGRQVAELIGLRPKHDLKQHIEEVLAQIASGV